MALAYWEYHTPNPALRNPPFPRYILSIVIITGRSINFAMLGYALQLFSFLQTAGPPEVVPLAPCGGRQIVSVARRGAGTRIVGRKTDV